MRAFLELTSAVFSYLRDAYFRCLLRSRPSCAATLVSEIARAFARLDTHALC